MGPEAAWRFQGHSNGEKKTTLPQRWRVGNRDLYLRIKEKKQVTSLNHLEIK